MGKQPLPAKRGKGLEAAKPSEASPKLAKGARTSNRAGLAARSKAAKGFMRGAY